MLRVIVKKHKNIILHLSKTVFITNLARKQFIAGRYSFVFIPKKHTYLLSIVLFRMIICLRHCFVNHKNKKTGDKFASCQKYTVNYFSSSSTMISNMPSFSFLGFAFSCSSKIFLFSGSRNSLKISGLKTLL